MKRTKKGGEVDLFQRHRVKVLRVTLCFSTESESKPSKQVSFIDFRVEEERTVPFVSMWVDFD